MKMFSITMGNRAGELEVVAEANFANRTAHFKTLVNGIMVYQGGYEEARAIAMEIFQLNKETKENSN